MTAMASTKGRHSCRCRCSSSILQFLLALLASSPFSSNLSADARRPIEIFKLKTRMTLSDYTTEIGSLDLPTLDAYDPELSTLESQPPLPNQNQYSLIAPSPLIVTNPPLHAPIPSPTYGNPRISNPPVYGSSPIASPQYGATKPTLQPPVGAPTHNNKPGSTSLVWCVARPTVSDPVLQRAMDYACGSGADCGPVKPNGPCYVPNTFVAHASYAFNSYWQRTKILGGTCDFGGTAMLINVDPSYDGCQFVND